MRDENPAPLTQEHPSRQNFHVLPSSEPWPVASPMTRRSFTVIVACAMRFGARSYLCREIPRYAQLLQVAPSFIPISIDNFSVARMPRYLWLHVPGAFYHVTLRGNHRQSIFFSPVSVGHPHHDPRTGCASVRSAASRCGPVHRARPWPQVLTLRRILVND